MSDQLRLQDHQALGARLRMARESRRYTQQQIAERLGMSRTTMVAIEKGERQLKPAELVRLAEVYGLDLSELLQRPTPVESFSVQLRGVLSPAAPFDSSLLPHIETFEHLCEDYLRLERLCQAPLHRRYPALYDLKGVDPELAAEDVAVTERGRLGLGEGPLLNLRDVLEGDVGLRIFQIEMPSMVAGMFAYTDDLGGCVAVNRYQPIERRRQSLAHEYGHFLVTRFKSEILYSERYQRRPAEERFAETFARSFLMPPEGLRRRYMEIQRERGGSPTCGDLCRLAYGYNVSVEAMARRLEELRLLPAGTWDRLSHEGFKVREAQRLLGLEPRLGDDGLLPARYIALSIEAWQKGELTEGQLARLLRTDRLGARELIGGAERVTEETAPATVDLSTPLYGVG